VPAGIALELDAVDGAAWRLGRTDEQHGVLVVALDQAAA
jgi:hypothetical protein